jgi:pilus assembly protein CpaB
MKRLTPAAVTLMTVIVVGLLVTAYFAKMLVAEESKSRFIAVSESPSADFREIPMALGTLKPGTEVTAAHLGTARIRVEAIEPETLLSERALIGRIVKEPIRPGTPIRSSQLYEPGERPPLEVSSGMRAVSISFSPRGSFVGGFLQSGQYVDVYLTPYLDSSHELRLRGGLTLTLLKGVRVLAVGGNTETDPIRTVTLELTPEQANIVILAREKGEIALSYNPDGKGGAGLAVKDPDRPTLDEILGLTQAELPSPTATTRPRPFTSETFKGARRTTLQFESAASTRSGDQP